MAVYLRRILCNFCKTATWNSDEMESIMMELGAGREWELRGNGSRLCTDAGFGIGGVETLFYLFG